MKAKKKIFIDMDNTVADFSLTLGEPLALEQMYEEGFFQNLGVIEKNILSLIEELAEEFEVYILSACIESEYCIPEKKNWLAKHLSIIPTENHLLIPVGESKANFMEKDAILIDDYGKNLRQWQAAGGTAIRFDASGKKGISSMAQVWEILGRR